MGEDDSESSRIDLENSVSVQTFFASREKLIAKEKTHRSGMSWAPRSTPHNL